MEDVETKTESDTAAEAIESSKQAVENVVEEEPSRQSLPPRETVTVTSSTSSARLSALTDVQIGAYADTSPGSNQKRKSEKSRDASPMDVRAAANARVESFRSSGPITALSAHREELSWPQDWNSLEESQQATHPKLSVSVTSPETISSMMSKYVVYTVKTEPTGYSVRRRYKDFAWLRDVLLQRYTGLFIPALPATTRFTGKTSLAGGKTDVEGDYVKNRLSQLHMFAQQICKIPFLRTDPSLFAFISVQGEREFKAIVENGVSYEKCMGFENWENHGLSAWFRLIDGVTLDKVDTPRTLGDFKRQLDGLRAVLDTLDKECRVTGRKALQCAESVTLLTDATFNWQKLELDLLDPNKNEYQNPHGPTIKPLMSQLIAGQIYWSSSVSLIPKIIARILLSGIQYQFVQVEGFRALLTHRENIVSQLDKAEKERLKAFEDREKSRNTAGSASASTATPKRSSMSTLFAPKNLADLEDVYNKKLEAVNMLQLTADRLTKGLIYCEIDRFNLDRVDNINQLLGSLAAVNLEIAATTNKKWTEVVAMAGLDTEKFAACVELLHSTIEDEDIFND